MILLCNDMRIIRYQLKLRVYTQEVMLINSTVFAVERLTKFITNGRFSFASLFLRASLALRNICPAVTTLPEIKLRISAGRRWNFHIFALYLYIK